MLWSLPGHKQTEREVCMYVFHLRKRTVVIVAMLALMGLATWAVAAWLINGSGNGYAKAGTPVSLTTQALTSAEITGDLAPGQTGKLNIKVQNDNGFPVTITSVTGSGTVVSDNEAACAGSNVSVINKTGLTLGPIPANGVGTIVVTGGVSMSSAAPTGCQGIRFTAPITFTATT